jgi:hypothetical protein
MKRTLYLKLIVAMILAVPLFAQDVPQPRPWTIADLRAEVGDLYLQVRQQAETIQTLQARIRILQDENAKLKGEKK